MEGFLEGEHPWSTADIGQNAISGILNDPNQHKSGNRPLKGMDNLAPIPQSAIKKIRTSEFDPYIKSLGEVFDKYHYNRAIGLSVAVEGTPTLAGVELAEQDSFNILVELTTRLTEESGKRKMQQIGPRKPRMLSVNAPPLETVPNLFFASDFSLEMPQIFSEVCEDADLSKLTSEDAFLTCGLLQDKLALFLDAVEVRLMKEISRRSSSFFSALHTLQNLNGETQMCVEEIRSLRENMSQLSQTHIGQSLEVGRLFARRENFMRLHKTIKSIYTIEDRCSLIYKSVEEGKLEMALDHIDDAIRNLKGLTGFGSDDTIGSKGIKAVQHLNNKLRDISFSVCFTMEADFVKILITDAQDVIRTIDNMSKVSPKIANTDAAASIKSILKWKSDPSFLSANTISSDDTEVLRKHLIPIIHGLLRMDKMVEVFQSYREALVKELKSISKRFYPSVVFIPDEATAPGGDVSRKKDQQNILAKQLRTMTFDSFFELITMVYIALLHIMQRASTVHAIVTTIISADSAITENSTIKNILKLNFDAKSKDLLRHQKKGSTDDDDDDLGSIEMMADPASVGESANNVEFFSTEQSTLSQLVQESNEVLLSISDVANNRCAKLIGVRADQNKQLNPNYFYKLYSASMEFIYGSEKICGRLCFGLKGALISQAKAFLTHFHDERSRQIAVLVENDQWVKAEVPSDFQNIICDIVKSANLQPSTDGASEEKLPTEELPDYDISDVDDGDISSAAAALKTPTRSPMKPEQKPDIAKSSRYLVVGSQKFHVAGCVLLLLKMITEYIQCLEHIPTISTEVLNRLIELFKLFNSKTCQVILGAGATKSAGLKNINAGHIALAAQSLGVIIALIPYVKQVVEKHLPAKQQILASDFDRISKAINWDKPEPKDILSDEAGSVPMSQLVKETVTLHRVLSKYLEVDTLRKILGNVFRLYNNKMEEEFKGIELFTSAGKNSQLSSLDNVDGPGNHLEVVVNNIKIKDRRRTAKK
ncbi:hypothetical protein HDU67_003795 [Dinochytrium kinnereticum]|nr:hypothetical protein HDU67_003795 [Dinochytrium kinnereticum]